MDQDKATTARLDSIVESDVSRGFRIRTVPNDVLEILRLNEFLTPPKVKFIAMNAARRRDINEEVQMRYHRDLRNPDILSNAQIRKLVEARGEWSIADDQRLAELRRKVNETMLDLYREGYTEDGEAWQKELADQVALIETDLARSELSADERKRFHKLFERWASWTPEKQVVYNVEYAAEQGLDAYRPDRDLNDLLSLSPDIGVADALQRVEELRDKQRRLVGLVLDMNELQILQIRHAHIFSGSAESRQSNAEELAQIYFACEPLDENDKPTGKRLAPTFDEFYHWPFEAVRWFVHEAYFFHQNIPEVEAHQYLETFGFRKAERANEQSRGENGPSDASPDPQSSNSVSVPVTGMALGSTVEPVATT